MRIVKNKNLISENLSEKIFILNSQTGEYIELNEAASSLWKCFDEQSTAEMLIQYLIDEYEIDRSIAIKDVNSFIEECVSCKLISCSET